MPLLVCKRAIGTMSPINEERRDGNSSREYAWRRDAPASIVIIHFCNSNKYNSNLSTVCSVQLGDWRLPHLRRLLATLLGEAYDCDALGSLVAIEVGTVSSSESAV